MNWYKLKQKFPFSEIEIREHSKNTKASDSRAIIENYLESKGYNIKHGFIHALRIRELDLEQRHEQEYMNDLFKHVWEGKDYQSMMSWVLNKKTK